MELMEGGRKQFDRGCPITYGHLDMKPWLAEAWSNVLAGPVLGARVERSVGANLKANANVGQCVRWPR